MQENQFSQSTFIQMVHGLQLEDKVLAAKLLFILTIV